VTTYYLWPNIHTTWNESFVEFSLMFMIGFCAGWLISCLLMGCSFYHYRHYMVMGNFCMLIAALGVMLFPIGRWGMSGRVCVHTPMW
jgi:cytosine/uracil/thiamine/allantoin permease